MGQAQCAESKCKTTRQPPVQATPQNLDEITFKPVGYPGMALHDEIQPVDFEKLNSDLVRIMDAPDWDDGSYAPLLIRLAWHSSGTYDCRDGSGGSNGATMRYELEAKDPDNEGLAKARSHLEPLMEKYPGLSCADLWVLASYVAIGHTGGPIIPFTGGRIDAGSANAIAPGRLPNPERGLADGFEVDSQGALKGWEKNAQHVRDVFERMGIQDREIVALLCGGHVYGRCHNENSGYAGAWVENPTFFSNEYAADMIGDRWQAVMHDTRLSDGGFVPEEVRPSPGKRQYIDLSKYEPDVDERAAVAAPNALEFPPGRYQCASQWVNCRKLPDTGSSIIGRFVQDDVLSLISVKVFGTAVRGLAERGGWVSIVGSAGKMLFRRVGDLDEHELAGNYRVTAAAGAPLFDSPTQSSCIGRVKVGETVICARAKISDGEPQQGFIFAIITSGNNVGTWMQVFSPERGASAEMIVKGYNEKPRQAIKGQTGHQMMLVSDMVLLWDAKFKQHLEAYAEDEELLKKEFGEAFKRLTELGCPWSPDYLGTAGGGACVAACCPVSGARGLCPLIKSL